MATGNRYQIVEGPPKFDLMLALFEHSQGDYILDFTLAEDSPEGDRVCVPVGITTLSYAGYTPSMNDWMIEGRIPGPRVPLRGNSRRLNFSSLWEKEGRPRFYRAIYSSRDRKGYLVFTEKLLTPEFLTTV